MYLPKSTAQGYWLMRLADEKLSVCTDITRGVQIEHIESKSVVYGEQYGTNVTSEVVYRF